MSVQRGALLLMLLISCAVVEQPPTESPKSTAEATPLPKAAPTEQEPPPPAGSRTLRVELLRAYMASKRLAAFDVRVTNRSDRDLAALRLYFELRDAAGAYIGEGRGAVQPLAVGASQIMDVDLGRIDVRRVATWRATVNAALGEDGIQHGDMVVEQR